MADIFTEFLKSAEVSLNNFIAKNKHYTQDEIDKAIKDAQFYGEKLGASKKQIAKIKKGQLVYGSTRSNKILAMAEKAIDDFLNNLSESLDFELAPKTNPKNPAGEVIGGKFEILNIYRKRSKFVRDLIGYKILFEITDAEPAIKTADEDPLEAELRHLYGAAEIPIPRLKAAVSATPPQPATTPVAPLPPTQPQMSFQERQDNYVKSTGLDPGLVGNLLGIKDGLFKDEGQLRSNNIFAPYGRYTDVALNYGGYSGLADYLLRGGQTKSVYLPVRTDPNGGGGNVGGYSVLVPTMPLKSPYVRFHGSPNIFDRQTGKWISPEQAPGLGIFNTGAVQDVSSPRPEVKIGSDFAIFNNRDLSVFPV